MGDSASKLHTSVEEALVDPGSTFLWVNTREKSFGLRLHGLSEALAHSLKAERGGSIGMRDGIWQWEITGRRAAALLAEYRLLVRLAVVPRGERGDD